MPAPRNWTIETLLASGVPTPGGCIEWTRHRSRQGYGTVGYKRKVLKAHRLAWMLATGSDPGAMCVLHRCDNPPCINPAHLFLGTNRDNVADKMAKGRMVLVGTFAAKKAQTHCHRGHPLDNANTTFSKRGTRSCKRCNADRARARRKTASASGCSLDKKYRPNR